MGRSITTPSDNAHADLQACGRRRSNGGQPNANCRKRDTENERPTLKAQGGTGAAVLRSRLRSQSEFRDAGNGVRG